jgi:cytidyltransferase-like protein
MQSNKNIKKVLIAGFFDRLHPGHIVFIKKATDYGSVYISLGSDDNLRKTKHREPVFNQSERKLMLKNIKGVVDVNISKGEVGPLSFKKYLNKIKPDIFIINEDGHTKDKLEFVESRSIKYIILKRTVNNEIRKHSTTELIKSVDNIPHRLDLVGFYDQIKLNKKLPGNVILANIKTLSLKDRSGMSSSTRNIAKKIWNCNYPNYLTKKEIASYLFELENKIDSKYISGVVDQIGISYEGINRLSFDNSYWPYKIETIKTKEICKYISKYLYLIHLGERPKKYDVFDGREKFTKSNLEQHQNISNNCWRSIKTKNIVGLGQSLTEMHSICKKMIPGYESEKIRLKIQNIQNKSLGAKLMGAGGYGYLLVVSEKKEKNYIPIEINV